MTGIRRVFAALAALAFALVVAPLPAQAEPTPAQPPKLDVPAALTALETTPIHRAPGAVAWIDEQRVRAEMAPNTRILVAPYKGDNYPGKDDYQNQVYNPIEEWAKRTNLRLIKVEGLGVDVTDGPGYGPSDIPSLRQTTAYLDVTQSVLTLARLAKGVPRDQSWRFEYTNDKVVPPTPSQVDAMARNLERTKIYNAPGREDPVLADLADQAGRAGITLRVAALPRLTRGQPLIDYAPALAGRFPGEVIMVTQGRWLDAVGPDQAEITSSRDYAYGRFEIGSFTKGSTMSDRIGTVLERLHTLRNKKPFGRPQPPAQPRPEPYDVRRTISAAAPWALLGSAGVLGGTGVFLWRLRGRRDKVDSTELRIASAQAAAKISALGALVLAAEERGDPVDSAVAERHDTARSLFDQAHTPVAMAQVAKIADEGIEMAGDSR
ncbi:hypothetical protein EV193_106107 [Herbihabitans rhizosphaerae]|uniref:Uncharacterized protein n=1 Tax=Herbihabitans rhizosphaerae TaxID=1872711 RepID=A0A4V2ESA3_9PSEU|nr:hypothetical protein [Herbihabitans rhizosphaerae]RZS36873.1 hypothetical protein EV193_106107 [Herbihabitans rhizosphaerae]